MPSDILHLSSRIGDNAGLGLQEAIDTIKNELPETPEIKYILEFIEYSRKRGFCKY